MWGIAVIQQGNFSFKNCIIRRSLSLLLLLLCFSAVDCALSQPANAQVWPITGGRVSSRDGNWLSPIAGTTLSSNEDDHKRRGSVDAWDISAPFGSPIYPMGAGQVVYAGCNNAGGYGCWALIDHKNGYTSLYAHMIDEGNGEIWVDQDEFVSAWTPLGRLGWTGTTSFGPHVHWEIRKAGEGRIRIDRLFPRYRMNYCKFCSSDQAADTSFGGLRYVVGQQATATLMALATSRYMIVLIMLLLFAGALTRPRQSLRVARSAGARLLRAGRSSNRKVKRLRDTQAWSYAHVALIILIPALLCGSTSAVAVWMTDEGLSARQVWRSIRFGLSPLVGPGYDSGARYAAVWGAPCTGVGTLGQVCSASAIVDKGLDWRDDIFAHTRTRPAFAVVPRLGPLFGFRQVRELLSEAHRAGGLVIVDIEADVDQAEEVINRLVPFGLDGIALDIEFADIVTSEEIERIAQLLAEERRQLGLNGDGILIVWDVFHNVRINRPIQVDGVQVVPIFTGYGAVEAKLSGLSVSQKLFESPPESSGVMAFDQRWPINSECDDLGMARGFDCQGWRELFSKPSASAVAWWVQQ